MERNLHLAESKEFVVNFKELQDAAHEHRHLFYLFLPVLSDFISFHVNTHEHRHQSKTSRKMPSLFVPHLMTVKSLQVIKC